MYNLTEKQKDALRWIVQLVRDGKLEEEFEYLYNHSSRSAWFSGGLYKNLPNQPFIPRGTWDLFMENGLVRVTPSSWGDDARCMLLVKAYEAVDTNFEQPASDQKLPLANSIFGAPNKRYAFYLFVLMPFAPDLKPVYDSHIKKVADTLNLHIARADDFFSQNSIMHEIWSAIVQSTILIADCTGKNPNVFYEIGLAHAIGKPVILITQKPDDVPFDLQHRRYIHYSYTPPGMEKFERDLAATILQTMNELEDAAKQG